MLNSLFFSDETMHKIYQDQGDFNFIYQIPQIIYSSLIAGIIGILVKTLGLSQDNIVKFKQEKEKKDLEKKHEELLTKLKMKFILFFIITFILLLFFWYYITCFCGIYINTQTHLFSDTIFSFISSLIYPFVIYLMPGIFRIYSLKSENVYLYKFSNILITVLV